MATTYTSDHWVMHEHIEYCNILHSLWDDESKLPESQRLSEHAVFDILADKLKEKDIRTSRHKSHGHVSLLLLYVGNVG